MKATVVLVDDNPKAWMKDRRLLMRAIARKIVSETDSEASGLVLFHDIPLVRELAGELIKRTSRKRTQSTHAAFAELRDAADKLLEISGTEYFSTHLANTIPSAPPPNDRSFARLILDAVSDLDDFEQSQGPFLPERELFALSDLPAPTPELRLRALVPTQQLGPVKFRLDDGVLKLEHDPADPDQASRSAAEQALPSLLRSGERITTGLEISNVDRRLGELVAGMQLALSDKEDIINCGLMNLALEASITAIEDEIPALVLAQLRAYCFGITIYVAAFPDWRLFTENAAGLEVTAADVQRLHGVGAELTAVLANSEVADPEVPKSLRFVFDAIRDPARASKRAFFGALRTVENLASTIFGGMVEHGAAVHQGMLVTSKRLGTVGLAVAAVVGLGALPVAAGSGWVPKAAQYVLDALKAAPD